MPEETKPDSFDWVKARSECSIESVFQILKQVVTSNVESAKTIFSKRSDVTFTVTSLDRRFVVTREDSIGSGVKVGCHVTFALSNSAEITVTRDATSVPSVSLFSAKPSFIQNGDCMLEVEGTPLKLWQVSRRALENLFFDQL
jgi:hypothetical protein